MAKISFYFDARRAKPGKTVPIKIAIREKGTCAFISTGVSVLPGEFDKISQRIIHNEKSAILNVLINKKRLDVESTILLMESERCIRYMDASSIRTLVLERIDPDKYKKEPVTFCNQMQNFAVNKINARTKAIYLGTLTKIQEFRPKTWRSLKFEDINRSWLTSFDNYLSKTSPGKNARNIHLRNIRAIFNEAIDDGLTDFYPFRKFKIHPAPTIKRALSIENMRQLLSMHFEDSYKEKYMDIFRLTFYLIGINFIDLCNLKEISNGRIHYFRAKTHKAYSVKVPAEATSIINKYLGNDYLLDILDKYNGYRGFYGMVSRFLLKIQPHLCTYSARHSWATIASDIGIPKDTISAALGHSMGNPTTAIYIDFDLKKVDEANRRVIDYVLYDKV